MLQQQQCIRLLIQVCVEVYHFFIVTESCVTTHVTAFLFMTPTEQSPLLFPPSIDRISQRSDPVVYMHSTFLEKNQDGPEWSALHTNVHMYC